MSDILKAPFPWFGGKSRVAHIVWDYFGDPINYVEPFAGSLAVLLGRQTEPRCETVNDKDCYLANFWRAIVIDPEEVAYWADWPVNESDLHSRHQWLVNQAEFREKMKTDPEYYDARVAGWWVWGISQWIGGGWCVRPEWDGRYQTGGRARGVHVKRPLVIKGGAGVHRKMPDMRRSGHGIHRKRQNLKRSGTGVHRALWKPRPSLRSSNGVHRQLPQLGGDGSGEGRGVHSATVRNAIYEYFEALSTRLRRVRVCCGDWKRIMGPSPTFKIGVTAVFLDPPYSDKAGRDEHLYGEEDLKVAHEVREWCITNGDNDKLRIALCGYEGEHEMPSTWTCVAWEANGGYANQRGGPGKDNAKKERIWFSPHCLKPSNESQVELFKV